MGIPIRVVISPRSIENNQAEITIRKTGEKTFVELENLKNSLIEIVKSIS